MRQKLASFFYLLASYLTQPASQAHLAYRLAQVSVSFKATLHCTALFWALLSLLSLLPGLLFRSLGALFQTKPFLLKTYGNPKILGDEKTFTCLFWNLCAPFGGYSITDGGVYPFRFRLDRICSLLEDLSADVICLLEVFDMQDARALIQCLKPLGYHQFCYHVNPKVIGVSSGIFVASKYVIDSWEFVEFPQATLIGRTKFSGKGALFFDLKSHGDVFATIGTAHLQHSEECAFATKEETKAKKAQVQLIYEKSLSIDTSRPLLVGGDFNGPMTEVFDGLWKDLFAVDESSMNCTWGGDFFCANFKGKRPSSSMCLDHVMLRKLDEAKVKVETLDVKFDAKTFSIEALSDHSGLKSSVKLG